MKKTKKVEASGSDAYGSWQNQERHSMGNIWRNETAGTGNVELMGWVCKKCGLTVSFENNKSGRTEKVSVLYNGGKCLFATGAEDLPEKSVVSNWFDFILVLVAVTGILGIIVMFVVKN